MCKIIVAPFRITKKYILEKTNETGLALCEKQKDIRIKKDLRRNELVKKKKEKKKSLKE